MQPQFTLRDVWLFVVRHRARSQFRDVPVWRIYAKLAVFFNRGQLHITAESGRITGMVIAVPESKAIRIEEILCVTPTAFKVLRRACRHTYPGQDLLYFRFKHNRPGRWPARKV